MISVVVWAYANQGLHGLVSTVMSSWGSSHTTEILVFSVFFNKGKNLELDRASKSLQEKIEEARSLCSCLVYGNLYIYIYTYACILVYIIGYMYVCICIHTQRLDLDNYTYMCMYMSTYIQIQGLPSAPQAA